MESVTSNSTLEQPQQLFEGKFQQSLTIQYPKLACNVNIYPDQIVFYRDGQYFGFETNGFSAETLQTLFVMMDGTRSIGELQELFAPDNPEVIDYLKRENAHTEKTLKHLDPLREALFAYACRTAE